MPIRKPTDLKKLHGTARADRRRGASQVDDRLPDPPADLDNEALAEWRRVVPVLDEMGLLTRADRAVLTGYWQSWARWMAAELTIAEEVDRVIIDVYRRIAPPLARVM